MGLFDKKPKYAFSDVLKGLQYAVNSVQEMLQAQQIQNLKKFWQEADGSPICQKVKVDNKEVDVPLVSLVSHSHLEMDGLEVKFKVRVGDLAAHSMVNRLDSPNNLTYAEWQIEMDKNIKAVDGDVADVIVRFKMKDAPEGIARLTDNYNKQI